MGSLPGGAGRGFDPDAAAEAVAAMMRPLGRPERAAQEKRYLKSDLDFIGVSVPDIRRVVTTAVRQHQGLDRRKAVAWALALWRPPVHERRMAAVEVLRLHVRQLDPADLDMVGALVREGHGWALVDALASRVAGVVARQHPDAWPTIDAWARDPALWVRRAALLALLPGIRAGEPDVARFERYATPMLADTEFFIRKAIGWLLREIARDDPGYTAAWTGRHLRNMSGVTFREAIRRLPQTDAERLAAEYRRSRHGRGREPAAAR